MNQFSTQTYQNPMPLQPNRDSSKETEETTLEIHSRLEVHQHQSQMLLQPIHSSLHLSHRTSLQRLLTSEHLEPLQTAQEATHSLAHQFRMQETLLDLDSKPKTHLKGQMSQKQVRQKTTSFQAERETLLLNPKMLRVSSNRPSLLLSRPIHSSGLSLNLNTKPLQ